MENTQEEIWKDTPGYEGIYQVSSLGSVKSKERKRLNGINGLNGIYNLYKEKILKPSTTNKGYFRVTLYKNSDSKTFSIHQLVAMSFLNHTPCGYKFVVNHINFNRLDNRVENLEIVTTRENSNLKHVKSTSKYVGVSWYKATSRWVSHIRVNGVLRNLGYFKNEYDAHLAYQKELKKL